MGLTKSTYRLLRHCRHSTNKLFGRIDGLRKHVQVQHLEYKRPNEGFICPYQGCMTPLKRTMHFLNHTAREHGLCL